MNKRSNGVGLPCHNLAYIVADNIGVVIPGETIEKKEWFKIILCMT